LPLGLVYLAVTSVCCQVTFADGSTKIFSTVERPKMHFNATGFPTHMTFGVDPHAECGQYCSTCKTSVGFDDTYTLLRPLENQQI